MSKKRVLLADDHQLFREGLASILTAQPDFEVVGEAGDGLEVLVKARKLKPDLILMDIQLPEVSGLEVTKWLKEDEDLRQIPVVAVTAFAMKGDEEKIREGGCEAYIAKPISVGQFLDTVKQFTG